LREAAVRGHWDILLAFFESGHPFGKKPTRKLPPGAQTGDLRTKISDYLIERLVKEDKQVLEKVTHIAGRHIAKTTGDTGAMLEWLVALTLFNHQGNKITAEILGKIEPILPKIEELRDHQQDNIRDAAASLSQELEKLWI
jgi:hypothetical protein